MADEQETARAEQEAARVAAEQEAARDIVEVARDAAKQEEVRLAAEQKPASLADKNEIAELASAQEADGLAAEQEASRLVAEKAAVGDQVADIEAVSLEPGSGVTMKSPSDSVLNSAKLSRNESGSAIPTSCESLYGSSPDLPHKDPGSSKSSCHQSLLDSSGKVGEVFCDHYQVQEKDLQLYWLQLGEEEGGVALQHLLQILIVRFQYFLQSFR